MRDKRRLRAFSSCVAVLACCTTTASSAEARSSRVEIVRDQQPRATIVTPDDPVLVVRRAAEELQYHLRKSTGANLGIVPESHAAAQPSRASRLPHRIYLGDCSATRAAGIDPKGLPPAGFVIRLIRNDLFFAGHDSDGAIGSAWAPTRHGTLFAVYEFLDRELGVRWLWPGELGEVIPARSDLILTDCRYEGEPPFLHTNWGSGPVKKGFGDAYWPTVEALAQFRRDQGIWSLRHRWNTSTVFLYGSHYFYSAKYNHRFLLATPILKDGRLLLCQIDMPGSTWQYRERPRRLTLRR